MAAFRFCVGRCRMIELDEKYVDVIVKRYIDFVGSADKVSLIRDGQKIPYAEVQNSLPAEDQN